MIFANVKGIQIPEGVVKRITQGSAVLWQAAYDAIVSGVSPLTLPSAVQEAIVYLKQLGVCGQNGTPTPSVPVDIYCNNGALKAVDDELPVGYRRIASITFGGNTYYDTGEKLYGSDIVTITIADFVSSGQNLFGCYSGTGSDDINFSMYIYGTTTGQAYWRYGQTLYRPVLGGTTERTISFGAGGTTGFKTDVTYDAVEFETTSNARIGALPNSSSSKYDGTIKGTITIGTRLKYIPCIRISDGAIGYYETVKGVFLEPQGTTPVAGAYDYSHLVVKVVGTPEVLTIGQQTASVQDLLAVGDYKDEQDIISGSVTREVGIKVLDGTESGWTQGTTTQGVLRFYLPFDGAATPTEARVQVASTHFVYAAEGQTPGIAFLSSQTRVYFIPTDQTMTGTEWKAWLAAQYAAGTPVIVVYPLAEETTESVTAQPLNTAEGDNVISVTAEVSNIPLEVKYKRN